jgi:hypothetical protein
MVVDGQLQALAALSPGRAGVPIGGGWVSPRVWTSYGEEKIPCLHRVPNPGPSLPPVASSYTDYAIPISYRKGI